jgi:hypothetical protein
MKKIFFDTEFTGLHQNTSLISIGLVSDCGKKFYAELNDYDESQVDDWLKTNVIDRLLMSKPNDGEQEYWAVSRSKVNPSPNNIFDGYSIQLRCDKYGLKEELTNWLKQFGEVEMWSDCLAYDWVLFNQIFGHAFNIPKNVYYIPYDISTLFKLKGIDPDISRELFATTITDLIEEEVSKELKHNALWDAQVIRMCYDKMMNKTNTL